MQHEQSQRAFARARQILPGGVNSPVRSFESVGRAPIFVDHARGSRLTDIDGNTYIDYICSWGPLLFGHAWEGVTDGLEQAARQGTTYGLPTLAEVELAEQVRQAYPAAELLRMVNSGTEATMSALRVARGYTGRHKVIKFEGCYHGHSDGLLVQAGSGALTFGQPTSPGVHPDVVKDTLVCRYNDIESVEQAVKAYPDQVAALIIEPVAGNMGVIAGEAAFLQALRALATREGIVLIFDEVISGFRMALGGAAEHYGIWPDMVCFGKIIGGGLPVGAYGGRREIMECVSPVGSVYQAGTLSGNPLAMFMGQRMISYLHEHPEVYAELDAKGAALEAGLAGLLARLGLPYQVTRMGSLLCLFFAEGPMRSYDDAARCDTAAYSRYFSAMLDQGVLLAPSQFEALFLSTAHSQQDIALTLAAAEQALALLAKEA